MRIVGRFVEMVSWRMRRRAVRNALKNLRKHLSALAEPGCDVDSIGIEIYRDIASIELHGGPAGSCRRIWV